MIKTFGIILSIVSVSMLLIYMILAFRVKKEYDYNRKLRKMRIKDREFKEEIEVIKENDKRIRGVIKL